MKLYHAAIEEAVESWKYVQALPDYEALVGEILFREIFQQAPAAISMYQFGEGVDATVDSVPEAVFALPTFQFHAQRVVKTLEIALVMLLGENMSDLALTLQQLGARHIEYGVLPQHYRIVETALLRTLEIGLADRWTQDLRKGWAAVFKFLAKAMMSGCEHELAIIKEEQAIKERRIRLEITQKSKVHTVSPESYTLSPASSSESKNCPRWSPTCVVEAPLGRSSQSLPPSRDGKAMARRNSFDTTPTLPRRSYHVEDEEDWDDDLESQATSQTARSSFNRSNADTSLPRPTRSCSPERVLE
ncbi:MAG: hypothetical protein SGILL_010407 [Bacillariaceae sp.]